MNRQDTLPEIILVEDEVFFRLCWQKLEGVRVRVFPGPKEFWQMFAGRCHELRVACIVTDLYFEDEPDEDGVDFAKRLRGEGYKGKIFTSSNEVRDQSTLIGVIDRQLSKVPREAWAAILAEVF